jgi:hypothetical protein
MVELSEDAAERAGKYIAAFEKALQTFVARNEDSSVKVANIRKVTDTMHRYLQDAHYYLTNKNPTTSLASIAYAEGLMDALNFLQLTEPKTAE